MVGSILLVYSCLGSVTVKRRLLALEIVSTITEKTNNEMLEKAEIPQADEGKHIM
jgi:hypothetical protein